VRRYRTEIVIPASRLVTLQLPEGLPPGRAVVSVAVAVAEPAGDAAEPGDHAGAAVGFLGGEADYEWWDEFGDDDEPGSLAVRLVALES
jgi:hypothetical protein